MQVINGGETVSCEMHPGGQQSEKRKVAMDIRKREVGQIWKSA
jgi:hypothetical protein